MSAGSQIRRRAIQLLCEVIDGATCQNCLTALHRDVHGTVEVSSMTIHGCARAIGCVVLP